jgi:hypothetical protein
LRPSWLHSNCNSTQKAVAVQFDNYTKTVILSGAAFQA